MKRPVPLLAGFILAVTACVGDTPTEPRQDLTAVDIPVQIAATGPNVSEEALDNLLGVACLKALNGKFGIAPTAIPYGDVISFSDATQWCESIGVSNSMIEECARRIALLIGLMPAQQQGNPCLAAVA